MPEGDRAPRGDEIYVEFVTAGNSVKATAIDAATGREAIVIGPRTALSSDLQKLAVAKLRRLLAKD